MVDQLARRASEDLHRAQESARFTVGMPRRRHRGLIGLIVVGAVALAVVVGVQLMAGGDPEDQSFIGPTEQPTRDADVILYFTHDFDPTLGEIAATDIAGWDDVEFAVFWDAAQAKESFLSRNAGDAFILERAEQNSTSFLASVRIWVRLPDGNPWPVLERVLNRIDEDFPNRVGTELTEMDGDYYQRAVVLVGSVHLGPSGVHRPPTPDNPWGIDMDALSEYARPVLGDEELTFDEYRAAVDALVDCVRSQGVLITDPVYSTEIHQFDYLVGGYATVEESDAAMRIHDACHAEYLDDITSAWVGQVVTPEMAQAIRDDIAVCLSNLGLEISAHPSHAEVVWVLGQARKLSEEAGSRALRDCMRSY